MYNGSIARWASVFVTCEFKEKKKKVENLNFTNGRKKMTEILNKIVS